MPADRPQAVRPRLRQSLTLRLTMLFVLASSLVLLALGQLIARSVDQHFVELDHDAVKREFATSTSLLLAVRSAADLEQIGDRFASMLAGQHGLALRVADRSGRVWFSTPSASAAPESAPDADSGQAAATGWGPGRTAATAPLLPPDTAHEHTHAHAVDTADSGVRRSLPLAWTHDGRTFRGLARELGSQLPDGRTFQVTIGVATAHHDHYMVSLRNKMWTFVAAAMVVMGLLGWIAARSGLAPLLRLRREAESVTAARLDRRLTDDDLPAELAELAATLNEMLARLQDSFTRLSELSSDLAHELRTPLSNLMTQTQVGLSRARSAEDYREVLTSNAEEMDRLARMVSDMLFLAKSEHGLARPRYTAVELQALGVQLASFYEALAAERQLGLRVEGSATIAGDRSLLLRALSNLLSNAIRHATPGSEIVLRIATVEEGPDTTRRAAKIRLAVRNSGEILAPDVQQRMFDRFFRGDSSRQHDTEGAGLGLAIARSIALAHEGTIGVVSVDGLTEVFLDLPEQPADSVAQTASRTASRAGYR